MVPATVAEPQGGIPAQRQRRRFLATTPRVELPAAAVPAAAAPGAVHPPAVPADAVGGPIDAAAVDPAADAAAEVAGGQPADPVATPSPRNQRIRRPPSYLTPDGEFELGQPQRRRQRVDFAPPPAPRGKKMCLLFSTLKKS